MLEVCPLIAASKPRLEVHFLGIGIRKSQTARLVSVSYTHLDVYKRQIVDGVKPVKLYTLKNAAGMEVCVTNFGGRIVSIDVYKRQTNLRICQYMGC